MQSKQRLAVTAAQILGEIRTRRALSMSTTEAPPRVQDREAILGTVQDLLNRLYQNERPIATISSHAARLSTGASVSTRSRRPKMRSCQAQQSLLLGHKLSLWEPSELGSFRHVAT